MGRMVDFPTLTLTQAPQLGGMIMGRKLVAYYSATDNTAKLAEWLADSLGADIFGIEPANPYPSLNDSGTDCQKVSHPEIRCRRDNMCEYSLIFLGFPVCQCSIPTIIHSFIESYDMRDKTIIPFAVNEQECPICQTSMFKDLACPGAALLPGHIFSPDVQFQDIAIWGQCMNVQAEKITSDTI